MIKSKPILAILVIALELSLILTFLFGITPTRPSLQERSSDGYWYHISRGRPWVNNGLSLDWGRVDFPVVRIPASSFYLGGTWTKVIYLPNFLLSLGFFFLLSLLFSFLISRLLRFKKLTLFFIGGLLIPLYMIFTIWLRYF